MLSPQFYSQVTVCPLCKGWGTEKVSLQKGVGFCRECGGAGVFLAQSEQTFVWGLPTFIDFKRRARIKFIKIFLFILAFLFFILIFYLISLLEIPKLGNFVK